MIFCRTSLIFSCRHTLVGNMSEYLVWKAAVAWAGRRNKCKWKTDSEASCIDACTVCMCVRVLPDGKKPCSWNSCMTSALLWSSVLRSEEYGTFSNSSSARRTSPSVAGKATHTGSGSVFQKTATIMKSGTKQGKDKWAQHFSKSVIHIWLSNVLISTLLWQQDSSGHEVP